jgi:hypothetical protein
MDILGYLFRKFGVELYSHSLGLDWSKQFQRSDVPIKDVDATLLYLNNVLQRMKKIDISRILYQSLPSMILTTSFRPIWKVQEHLMVWKW